MTKSSKSSKSSKSTTNRPKPLVAKAGVTKNRDRRYCSGFNTLVHEAKHV